VRVDAWFAIAAAFSSVPPFLRYAVIPVARKLWLPSLVAMPAAAARRPKGERIDAIGLHSARPSVDLDACRIEDATVDSDLCQRTRQPETVVFRLITDHDPLLPLPQPCAIYRSGRPDCRRRSDRCSADRDEDER
jgi:hypothetical protein